MRSGSDERARYVDLLFDRLPAGAAVLELGCASGVPTTARLASRFRVTGVDLSARQIAMARAAVPGATFLQGDMTQLAFLPGSFDAVLAFYSIIHVPRSEHGALLVAIAGWLRPGGLLIATMGSGSTEAGFEPDWLGVPMFWSYFDSATNCRLVSEAGFVVERAQEELTDEDGVAVPFLWMVAATPAAR